jgi:membrane protein required for colicin V production
MGASLSGADLFIVFVLLVSTIVGVMRGFVREAVALLFWILGLWAAWTFGRMIEPHLGGYLAEPSVRPWIGRLVVLLVVLGIGFLVGLLTSFFMRSIGLGTVDRVLGFLFGVVRGMVLVGVFVIGGELLHLNHEIWWERAALIPYGETAADWLRAMVGERGEPWATLDRLSRVKAK